VALGRLARLYTSRGDFEKAASQWQISLKANPDNEVATLSLAELYADQLKQPDKAYELAQSAYKLAPDDVRALRLYGRLAFQNHDHPVAVGLFRDAVRQQPNDAALLFDLAEAAYSVGGVAEALEAARTALRQPGFSRANDAKIFVDLADPSKTPPVGLAEQVLKDRPQYVPALVALGMQNEAKQNRAEARKDYEKVLSLYSHFTPVMKRLAILYSTEPENYKVASKLIIDAMEAYPGDPELAKAAGLIAYYQGDWERAARLLEQAMQTSSLEDAKGRFFLGMAYYQIKRKDASRTALHRAVTLALAEPELSEANRKLAELK